MDRILRGIALCAAATLAACASAGGDGPVKPEKHYRTGSNIAVPDHGMRDSTQTLEPNSADPNLSMPSAGRIPGPGGR